VEDLEEERLEISNATIIIKEEDSKTTIAPLTIWATIIALLTKVHPTKHDLPILNTILPMLQGV